MYCGIIFPIFKCVKKKMISIDAPQQGLLGAKNLNNYMHLLYLFSNRKYSFFLNKEPANLYISNIPKFIKFKVIHITYHL